MSSKLTTVVALAIGIVAVSVPLLAHHGTAAFENDKKVTLKGTVTQWLWSNPHCLLEFDVKGDDGKSVHWIGETQNPVSITNVGWSKAAIKAGDQVTVVLFAVKNGQPLGRVSSVTLPNGKTLLTGEGESKEVHDKLERDARAAQPNCFTLILIFFSSSRHLHGARRRSFLHCKPRIYFQPAVTSNKCA